jgi:hypothetical protein
MTFKVNAVVQVQGETFSPTRWEKEAGIACAEKRESGNVYRRGPKIGTPQGFGDAVVDLSKDWQEIFLGSNPKFWEKLRHAIQIARDSGATDINIQIDVAYSDQCNLSFNPKALEELASLGVEVGFTAYMADDEDVGDQSGKSWKI